MWRLVKVNCFEERCVFEKRRIEAASAATFGTHCTHLGKLVHVELTLLVASLLISCYPRLAPQLLEVNKQWDQHFRSMKQQYEQKVTWGF